MSDTSDDGSLYGRLRQKLSGYANMDAAFQWLEDNYDRVTALFNNDRVRNFVFEPIKDVFELKGRDEANEIRAAITRVAVANMVMAGLPGKMGVGVLVSMALEAWMAYVIARRVGIRVEKPADVLKYFTLLAGVIGTVIWGIKALLGVAFSAFSIIPGINPLVFAEIAVTNLIGVLFWIGFEEARKSGSFAIPLRTVSRIVDETKALYLHQYAIIKRGLSPANLRMMGERIAAWFRGDIPHNAARMRGELFATAAMAYLLARKTDQFEGPVGEIFIQAIRDRFPELADATHTEIAKQMSHYSPEGLDGDINEVKGRMFELLVEQHENADGDTWMARVHDDQSYPGSDLIFTDERTGRIVEVSLKATDSPAYIENALLRYPDIPIMTTEEVAVHFDGHPSVDGTAFRNAELTEITEENFVTMLDKLTPISAVEVSGTGVAAAAIANLWPFVAAYIRGRITSAQLRQTSVRVFGESGELLAVRLGYGALLGPVFAWYLLARGVILLTNAAESVRDSSPAPDPSTSRTYRLSVSFSPA